MSISQPNPNLYNLGSQPNFEGNNLNRAISTYMQRNENPIPSQNVLTAQQLQNHQQRLFQQYNQQIFQNVNNNPNMQNYGEGRSVTNPAYNIPNIRQMSQQDASSFYPQNMPRESGQAEKEAKSTSLSDIWKDDRRLFLMFIHTLFKCMKKFNSSKEEELLSRAKQIINECTEKNRAGVPNYSPLSEVISTRLQSLDGMQVYWNQAEKYVLKYHSRKNSDISNHSSDNEMIPL
jgi:hypothetical protein